MKKFLIILVILAVVFFFPKSFQSSPGFTTPEYAQEFEASRKHCAGFEMLTNAEQMAADAPGESLCFGWLIKNGSSENNGPTTAEAKNFIEKSWPDLIQGIPSCEIGAEVCPSLVIGVSDKFSEKTGKHGYLVTAEIVGFADDSYSGYGREANVKNENGKWVYTFGNPENNPYSYTNFKLCRKMQRYPEGAPCP